MLEPSPSASDRRDNAIVTGQLRQTVLWLALPVLCEQLLSFFVGFYDTYLSGRISAEATTAIGLGAYVGWLASMLFGLVGTGTTALVSRHWGANQVAEANRITSRSMALAAVMGCVAYGVIYPLAPLLPRLLQMPDSTAAIVVRYIRIDGFGHLFTGMSLVGAAALRGAGDMRTPLLVLGWVNVLNVIASTALVYGIGPFPDLGIDLVIVPKLGIDGIVAGTVLARMSGGLWMVITLARGRRRLRIVRGEIRLRGETVRRILRIGAPAALDGAITWGGQLVFLMIISQLARGALQSEIFAAHMVGIRVEAVTYLPAVAWGYAAATMIGQSLGAGDRRRAVRAGHEATLQCVVLGALISLAFLFGADAIYRFMHDDPRVWPIGVPAFRLLAFFQVPLVISITYVFALRGAGDTRFPLAIAVIGTLLIRLPVAYVFGVLLDGGLLGAWIGMCADLGVRAVLVTIRYCGGTWVETRV